MRRLARIDKLPDRCDAIFTADWHLRDTVPVCRTDDFHNAMWRKVDYIAELGRQYDCPVYHAGDLFDHWKPSPWLLSHTIDHLPDKFWTVYGNHDLPQHNLSLSERSGIHTLEAAEAARVLKGTHMGQTPTKEHAVRIAGRTIVVWHEGVWKRKPPWPGCTAWQAKDLLKEFPEFDVIVTGDFHTPCVERYKGRLLVNSGSLMRQAADQIDYKPRVYLWNAEENSVVPAYLPIDVGAVSREHLDKVRDHDERINAFVAQLESEQLTELNFHANLDRYMRTNRKSIDARTRQIVRDAVE